MSSCVTLCHLFYSFILLFSFSHLIFIGTHVFRLFSHLLFPSLQPFFLCAHCLSSELCISLTMSLHTMSFNSSLLSLCAFIKCSSLSLYMCFHIILSVWFPVYIAAPPLASSFGICVRVKAITAAEL